MIGIVLIVFAVFLRVISLHRDFVPAKNFRDLRNYFELFINSARNCSLRVFDCVKVVTEPCI